MRQCISSEPKATRQALRFRTAIGRIKDAMATLNVKVVPGASRDRVVGRYGDALKIQVRAAPEAGKANEAVIALLADFLGIDAHALQIVRGHTQPRKVVEVTGIDDPTLQQRIDAALQ
jgi:uncharacterized protein (TIGR00251 family)